MTNWRKGSALLLVGLMIMSGLVAFSAPVIADKIVTVSTQTVTAEWSDTNMIDHPELIPADETLIINQNAANRLVYLGDDETTLSIGINVPNTGGAMAEWRATMQAGSGNAVVSVDSSDSGGTLANGTTTVTFNVNVANFGNVEVSYSMTCTVANETAGSSQQFSFEVYVSSVFHDDADDTTRDTPHEFTKDAGYTDYVVDNSAGGDAPFEAGDTFKEAKLTLRNEAPFTITDPQINLTAPTGISLVQANAQFVGTVAGNVEVTFLWRLDIASTTAPGVYIGTIIPTYERTVAGADVLIRENVRDIDYTVDFNFKDTHPFTPGTDTLWSAEQCYVTNVVITNDTRQIDYVAPYDLPTFDQSTYTDEPLTVEITIVNNGNTPLYNVEFEIIPGVAGADWVHFRNPQFFWDDGGALTYDTISRTFDVLAVGGTVTLSMRMFVLNDIPLGEHRLPIVYNGYYFDDGSLGGSTGYIATNGGTSLEAVFSLWCDDTEIACHVDGAVAGAFGDKWDLTAETVSVTIVNDEQYNFIDVIVNADFTGTPWYMPVIGLADPWVAANEANVAVPYADWTAGGNLDVTFDVDTDPTMTPDRYPFVLEITAVIEETLEVVTVYVDYTQGAVIDYGGFGPDVYIAAFTGDDEIVPGEDFALTLSLTNQGDDTLRNVVITIDADDTEEYDWDFEADFKAQFDWHEVFSHWGELGAGQVTWENSEFPSEMFYTMESLDVDNIREIVEINLYADGVYSDPGARIVAIRILDLAPGATTDVTFDMYADKDMVNGKPYAFPVTINGVDSEGVNYSAARVISVMSSLPGSSYNPVELDWFDAGIKALGLFLFFIIVLAILLFVYNMFKGDPYDEEEDDFDFEDDEPDFEPAPEPPAIEDTPEPEPVAEELVEP